MIILQRSFRVFKKVNEKKFPGVVEFSCFGVLGWKYKVEGVVLASRRTSHPQPWSKDFGAESPKAYKP